MIPDDLTRLRAFRLQAGWTLPEARRQLGCEHSISVRRLSHMERGLDRGWLALRRHIAARYGVRPHVLWNGRGDARK